MILLLILFIVCLSLFIYNVLKGKRLVGFYLKGFTSFLFILVFAYGFDSYFISNYSTFTSSIKGMEFALCIFIGLVAGLIGDLFLELMHVDNTKNKFVIIAFGTTIFLIGHLFYIAGLVRLGEFSYTSLIIGLAMTIIVFIGGKAMKLKMGKLEVLNYIYSFVIFTMIGQAIMNAVYFDFNQFSLAFMVGAILFGISDLLLAPLYFGDENRNSFVALNLITYYFGQVLIALSMFLL